MALTSNLTKKSTDVLTVYKSLACILKVILNNKTIYIVNNFVQSSLIYTIFSTISRDFFSA